MAAEDQTVRMLREMGIDAVAAYRKMVGKDPPPEVEAAIVERLQGA